MLEIISLNNEHITIKVKKNKKEILNALGIIDINNTNEFKIFNTPFALEILLKYTNNNDKLKQIYEHSLISWKKIQQEKNLNDYPSNPKLRHYQRVDVAILKANKRFGLFNEMRTGKTPTMNWTSRIK